MSELLTLAERPDPRRFSPALYPLQLPVRLRLGDIDVFGHVNNVAIQALHQEARAALLDVLWSPVDGVRPVQTIAVQHVTHFVAEAFYPGVITCCAGVGRVAGSSFVIATLLVDQAGRAVSTGDTVLVIRAGGTIQDLDPWRTALTARALRD